MTENINSSIGTGGVYSWNGPVCPICLRGYLGSHECNIDDLQMQIDMLQRKIDSLKSKQASAFDPSLCPCSPTRGGSGICGCVRQQTTIY